MASSITMKWTGDRELALSLRDRRIDDRVKHIIAGQFLYASDEAVKWAKENAPWTDRTGNARAGLHSGVEIGEDFWELYVAHSVFYGIYLETRWSGKYQILAPTILMIGTQLIARIGKVLESVGALGVIGDE